MMSLVKKHNSVFSQLFPIFALMPWFNLPFIVFDKHNLSFRSNKDKNIEQASKGCDSEAEIHTPNHNKQSEDPKWAFYWLCVKSYYTAPVNKFLFNLVRFQQLNGSTCYIIS